jgi:beta-N-acetylhexosaminidase
VAAAALVCAGCLSHPATASRPSRAPVPTGAGSPTPAATCAARVLAQMSEEQRVGQLFLLGLAGDRLGPAELDAVRVHHLGSVWFVATTSAGAPGVRVVADAVQALASPQATANVRFLVAANQEGGQVQALRGPGFSPMPPAVEQGRHDTATLGQEAEGWGRQLRAAGVNLDFAPVLDVVPAGSDADNLPIGALQREYGHDPATTGRQGSAVLAGLARAGVAPTVKHFPGLGRVRGNTDFAAGVVDSITTSDDGYLQSFRQGIDAGAPFVMVALATYRSIDPDHPAVFSPIVMRQLLRGRMGFRGVVMSDDLGATAAVADVAPGARAVQFLTAGGDLIVSKTADAALSMSAAILSRAAADPAFRGTVDEAVSRVLEAKQPLGLLPCGSS